MANSSKYSGKISSGGGGGGGAGGTVQGIDHTYDIQATLEGLFVGNARGLNSIDLQTSKVSAVQIAAGDYSVLVGGKSNEAKGDYSFLGGGITNYVKDSYSVLVGGRSCHIQGTGTTGGNAILGGRGSVIASAAIYSVLVGGYMCRVNADYVVIGGGDSNNVSANHACILGGDTNNVSVAYSCIVAGYHNVISSSGFSFIGGGEDNDITSSSNNCVIGGGRLNVISGSSGSSIISGGKRNLMTMAYGVITGGLESKVENVASSALSFGKITTVSDAQSMKTVAKVTTTDATADQEFLVNGIRLLLPTSGTNKVWAFNIQIVGHNTTDNTYSAYWLNGLIDNTGGTTTLQGSGTIGTAIEGINPGAAPSVAANDANNALQLKVTGLVGKTINWVATVNITQTFA